jgi:hypothetical protein
MLRGDDTVGSAKAFGVLWVAGWVGRMITPIGLVYVGERRAVVRVARARALVCGGCAAAGAGSAPRSSPRRTPCQPQHESS